MRALIPTILCLAAFAEPTLAAGTAAPPATRGRAVAGPPAPRKQVAAKATTTASQPAALAPESESESNQESGAGASAADPTPGLEVTEFIQREPDDGEPASVATRAYVSYDEDNLHVVFLCEDDPALVRARIAPRDRITDDDRVVVFLDTFDDNQRAYAFEVNPLGIQRDGFVTEGQDDDYTFDALWHSEGRMTPTGYAVRVQIPFSSLRFAKRSSQTWGIGLARYIERKSEKVYWPRVTDGIEGFVNQLGTLEGMNDISPGRRFQVVPYSTMADANFLDDELDEAAFRRTREQRYGVDVKAVLHDAVTVDVAVRPDFSQVEPDEPQVTVNQRFEVRVDEKRPFFIENAGFFETPLELFFSRRIADPTGGARVTSKLGPWVIGGLFMNDQQPGRVAADDPLYGRRAYAGVLRVQLEAPGPSTLGLFASGRELAGGFNRVYGADTRLKLGTHWVVTGQVAQAETREEDDPQVRGMAGLFKVRREGRHFDWSASYTQFEPNFVADLGFVPRVGFREVQNEWEYTFRPKKSTVSAWGPKLDASFNWDWAHRLQDAEVEISAKVELPADTQVELGGAGIFEQYKDQRFMMQQARISAETKWLPWLGVSGSYKIGTAVNHDPADTIPGVPGEQELLPFLGVASEAELGVTLRPTPRLEFKQSVANEWLRLVENGLTTGMGIRPVFTIWVLKSRLKCQVTRGLSIRAIANYEAVIPNPLLSDEDEERRLVPDVLVSYQLNPWSALHAGYTERFENVRLESGEVVETPRSNRILHLPTTSVDRQYFLKLSGLLRM